MVSCSLLDPPLQNETVVTTAEIVSLRGNSIDVTPYVTLQNAHQNFTLADFGTQFVTQVNTTGGLIFAHEHAKDEDAYSRLEPALRACLCDSLFLSLILDQESMTAGLYGCAIRRAD